MEFSTATDPILVLVFAGLALCVAAMAVWLAWREARLAQAIVLLIKDRDMYRASLKIAEGVNTNLRAQVASFDHDGDGRIGGSKAKASK